ncbi:hypothetical protein, partial [Endothiovibrio diazotrophicus]
MRRWTRSLAAQITTALLLLAVLGTGTVGFLQYELNLRKHDYVILNLTGQLRVLAQSLIHTAEQLDANPSPDEARRFRQSLTEPMALYGRIVDSLRARVLDPELTGRAAPLRCSWDRRSIAALEATAESWHRLRRGLDPLLADSARATQAAAYLIRERHALHNISLDLSRAFQSMMEGKLGLIMKINLS